MEQGAWVLACLAVLGGALGAGCLGEDSRDNDDAGEVEDPPEDDALDGEADADDGEEAGDRTGLEEDLPSSLDVETPAVWPTLSFDSARVNAHASPGTGTGEVFFTVEMDWMPTSDPAIAHGHIFLPVENEFEEGFIAAYDADTGELAWSFETDHTVRSPIIVGEEILYAGAEDGNLFALNPANGDDVWHIEGGGDQHYMTLQDELLHIASGHSLHALNSTTGDVVWSEDLGSPLGGNPARVGDRVAVASTGGDVLAINAETGAVDWSFEKDDLFGFDLTLAVDDDRVFAFSSVGDIVALDQETGEEVWSLEFEGDLRRGGTAMEDVLLVPAGDTVHALDKASGETTWEAQAPPTGEGYPSQLTSMAAGSDAVFAGTSSGSVIGVSADTGEQAWVHDDLTRVLFAALCDDVFYYAGPSPYADGVATLYALDAGHR